MIILVLYVLGTTADGYLAPSLEQIAKKLYLSEQLAGVTFLALANGAPDVLGAISAATSDAGGTYMSVGGLVGAGLYVSLCVTAVIMLMS